MGYARERIRYVSIRQMNEVLEKIKWMNISEDWDDRMTKFHSITSYIQDSQVYFRVNTKFYEDKVTTYVCRKDTFDIDEVKDKVNPGAAMMELSSYFKTPDLSQSYGFCLQGHKIVGNSAKPLLKSFCKDGEYDVWYYDINSAYGSICATGILPDTEHPRFFSEVKEGEVGFLLDSDLTMMEPGEWSEVVFH